MENQMLCYQCESVADGKCCNGAAGVCGKTAETSYLQDTLTGALIGLAKASVHKSVDEEIQWLMVEGLCATAAHANFADQRLLALIDRAQAAKKRFMPKYGDYNTGLKIPEDFDIRLIWQKSPDIRSLKSLLLFGIRGIASYAYQSWALHYKNKEAATFFHKALIALGANHFKEDYFDLINEMGDVNLRAMELLNKAKYETYGQPTPVEVPRVIDAGPFIIVSGHHFNDLKMILEQTADTGINVYSHSEMLPAHAYPEFRKYPHFKGHYGTGWQNQQAEFDHIPAAVVFTSNCVRIPLPSYADRVFTTGTAGLPGIPHIEDNDFRPVLIRAIELNGAPSRVTFPGTNGGELVKTGFGKKSLQTLGYKVAGAMADGDINHIFVIGGCDGLGENRQFYTDIAHRIPPDSVILTYGCCKFRFNDLENTAIAGVSRIIDVGQCGDLLNIVEAVEAIAAAAKCRVEELPLTWLLSWQEQRSIANLFSLFAADVHNVILGPQLPPFFTPSVFDVYAKEYHVSTLMRDDGDESTDRKEAPPEKTTQAQPPAGEQPDEMPEDFRYEEETREDEVRVLPERDEIEVPVSEDEEEERTFTPDQSDFSEQEEISAPAKEDDLNERADAAGLPDWAVSEEEEEDEEDLMTAEVVSVPEKPRIRPEDIDQTPDFLLADEDEEAEEKEIAVTDATNEPSLFEEAAENNTDSGKTRTVEKKKKAAKTTKSTAETKKAPAKTAKGKKAKKTAEDEPLATVPPVKKAAKKAPVQKAPAQEGAAVKEENPENTFELKTETPEAPIKSKQPKENKDATENQDDFVLQDTDAASKKTRTKKQQATAQTTELPPASTITANTPETPAIPANAPEPPQEPDAIVSPLGIPKGKGVSGWKDPDVNPSFDRDVVRKPYAYSPTAELEEMPTPPPVVLPEGAGVSGFSPRQAKTNGPSSKEDMYSFAEVKPEIKIPKGKGVSGWKETDEISFPGKKRSSDGEKSSAKPWLENSLKELKASLAEKDENDTKQNPSEEAQAIPKAEETRVTPAAAPQEPPAPNNETADQKTTAKPQPPLLDEEERLTKPWLENSLQELKAALAEDETAKQEAGNKPWLAASLQQLKESLEEEGIKPAAKEENAAEAPSTTPSAGETESAETGRIQPVQPKSWQDIVPISQSAPQKSPAPQELTQPAAEPESRNEPSGSEPPPQTWQKPQVQAKPWDRDLQTTWQKPPIQPKPWQQLQPTMFHNNNQAAPVQNYTQLPNLPLGQPGTNPARPETIPPADPTNSYRYVEQPEQPPVIPAGSGISGYRQETYIPGQTPQAPPREIREVTPPPPVNIPLGAGVSGVRFHEDVPQVVPSYDPTYYDVPQKTPKINLPQGIGISGWQDGVGPVDPAEAFQRQAAERDRGKGFTAADLLAFTDAASPAGSTEDSVYRPGEGEELIATLGPDGKVILAVRDKKNNR